MLSILQNASLSRKPQLRARDLILFTILSKEYSFKLKVEMEDANPRHLEASTNDKLTSGIEFKADVEYRGTVLKGCSCSFSNDGIFKYEKTEIKYNAIEHYPSHSLVTFSFDEMREVNVQKSISNFRINFNF